MRTRERSRQHRPSGPWLLRLGLAVCLGLAGTGAGGAAGESVPEALPGAVPFSAELRARLETALAEATESPRTRHRTASGAPLYSNRLLLERSPYLRQHAHNPVDWRPWGDAAFDTARRLGRPVLLSIGYSTCHWCHVMEDESFDDPEVARFLNAHFVAVKVDREVRPDVDAIYMAAVVALTGQGGWPLNVFLTPDRKPFYGGTYFPREDGRGRPGILNLLASISRAYGDEPAQVARTAETLEQRIRLELAGKRPDASWLPGPAILHAAVRDIERGYDTEWGGLGIQPKFPSRPSVRLLLRYYRRTGEKSAFDMALGTLEHMAAGGIRDQLGGGFHRYATDRRWRIPHFEKMLYDNALLAVAYLEGWQVSGRAELREVCRQTLEYLLREMTAEAGGFFSATDADSIGPDGDSIEGAYFTWTRAEVHDALPPALAELAVRAFGVEDAGPVEGRTALHRPLAWDALADELGFTPTALKSQLDPIRATLLAVRATRPSPFLDRKVLAAWNGLAISALARGGFALEEPRFVEAAERSARFVLEQMRSDGRLQRSWLDGVAQGPAFLEDHAFLVAGLLDLYEAAPDPRWLRAAIDLQAALDERFGDPDGGYFRTAVDQEGLIAREKPARDGAIPSGNSVAAWNLIRLHALTADPDQRTRLGALFSAFRGPLERAPESLSGLLLAVDAHLDQMREIVVVTPPGSDATAMLAPLRRMFVPNRVLAVVQDGAVESHGELTPLVARKRAQRGEVTAYVCHDHVCDLPTTDPATFASQLRTVRELPARGGDGRDPDGVVGQDQLRDGAEESVPMR